MKLEILRFIAIENYKPIYYIVPKKGTYKFIRDRYEHIYIDEIGFDYCGSLTIWSNNNLHEINIETVKSLYREIE